MSPLFSAITDGLASLKNVQQADGSFITFSSPDPNNFTGALQFHSVFSTALVLDCLSGLGKTQQSNSVKRQAAKFLLSQKSKHWSFNYWNRHSQEAKKMPYPDDLDDTFCSLAALFHHNPTLITGSVLAHVVQILTAAEIKEGGPYKTWLISETADAVWKDVDIAVNSNVAYFLKLQEIELPGLTDYIETCIKTNALSSPYYPSTYPILYFLGRYYNGHEQKTIQKFLLSTRTKGHWSTPLETALAISTLIRLQTPIHELQDAIFFLLSRQIQGSWEPYPFYTGVNPKRDKQFVAGSAALTTAFCLEALWMYQSTVTAKQNASQENKKQTTGIDTEIRVQVEKRFARFAPQLQKRVRTLLHKTLDTDTGKQIPLLPFLFAETIGSKGKTISSDFVMLLGIANLLGWMAYTIYDDFLDDEGKTVFLPIAIICHRELTTIFTHLLPAENGFEFFFQTTMDHLDAANMWEVSNTRITLRQGQLQCKNFQIPDYGDYTQLAQKSFGHALGPCAILFSVGYNQQSLEMQSLIQFFKHYLIARQLSDDMHDWEQDLKTGYINAVGAILLRKQYGQKIQENLSIKKVLPQLQKLFWYEVVDTVCALIVENSNKAKTYLDKCDIIVKPEPLARLLKQYEQSVQTTLNERQRALEFMTTYKK